MFDPDQAREPITEAEAQSQETLMPWVWGGFGLLLIAGVASFVLMAAPRGSPRHPQAAAPLTRPIGQHY